MKFFKLLRISLSLSFLTLTPLKGLAVGDEPLSSSKEATMAKTSVILFGIQMLNYFGTPLMRDLFAAAKVSVSDFPTWVKALVDQGLPLVGLLLPPSWDEPLPWPWCQLWGGPLPSYEDTARALASSRNPPAPVALAHHGQVEVEMPTDEHDCFFFSILAYLRVALLEEAFTQFLRQWGIYPMHPREGFVRLLTATLTDPQAPQNVRQAIRRNILLQIVNDAMGDAQHLFANQNASALAQQFKAWLLQILKGGRQFKLIEALALLKAFQALVTNNGKGLEDFLNNPNANLFLEFYLTQYLGQHVAGTDAYPMIGVTGGQEIAGMAPAIVEALGQAIHRQIPMFRLWNGDCWAEYEPVERLNIDEGTLPNLQMIHTVADPALRGQPGAIRNHFNLLANPYEAAVLRHVEAGWKANLKKSKYIHGYPIDEELFIPLEGFLPWDEQGNWLANLSFKYASMIANLIHPKTLCDHTEPLYDLVCMVALYNEFFSNDGLKTSISNSNFIKRIFSLFYYKSDLVFRINHCKKDINVALPWEIHTIKSKGQRIVERSSPPILFEQVHFVLPRLTLYRIEGQQGYGIGLVLPSMNILSAEALKKYALKNFRTHKQDFQLLSLAFGDQGLGISLSYAFWQRMVRENIRDERLTMDMARWIAFFRLAYPLGIRTFLSKKDRQDFHLIIRDFSDQIENPCILSPSLSLSVKSQNQLKEALKHCIQLIEAVILTLSATGDISVANSLSISNYLQELLNFILSKDKGISMTDINYFYLLENIECMSFVKIFNFSSDRKFKITNSGIIYNNFILLIAMQKIILILKEILGIPSFMPMDEDVANHILNNKHLQLRIQQYLNPPRKLNIPKKQTTSRVPVQPRPKRQPKPKPVEEPGAPSSALTSSEVEDYDLFIDDQSSHQGPTAEEKAYWRSLKKERSTQESLEELAETTYALNDPQANQTQNILWALPDSVRDAFVDYLAENDLDAHERLQNLATPQNNRLTEVELDDAVLVIAPALATFLRQLTFTPEAPAPKPQPKGRKGKQAPTPVRAPEPIRYYSDAAIRLFMARLVVDWYAHFHKWHSGKSGHNEQHVHRSWIAARQGPLGLRNLMNPSHNAIMEQNYKKNIQRQLLGETLGAGAQARAITGASEVLRLANERRGGQGIVGLLSFLQGTEVAIPEAPAPIEEEVLQPAQPNKKPNPQPKRKRK